MIQKLLLETQKEIIAMTTDSTKKQQTSSNQNEELAPVEQSTQDVEEINDLELDAVAGGLSCGGQALGEHLYHMDSPPKSNSVMQVRKRA